MPDIENEIAKAKETAFKQSQERGGSLSAKNPQDRAAARRSALFNIASGTVAGVQAAQQAIRAGDPLSAAILGMGGALQAPTFEQVQAARQAQIAEAELKRLEATPIEQVSPDLVKNLIDQGVDLTGTPLGTVNKISPILTSLENMRQREELRRLTEQGISGRFNRAQMEKRRENLLRMLGGTQGLMLKASAPELYQQTMDQYQAIEAALRGLPEGKGPEEQVQPRPGNRINVRRKSDGKTGTIKESDFNEAIYERL